MNLCPTCGDIDPVLDVHAPTSCKGLYSNGSPRFDPACYCGFLFKGIGSASSAMTALAMASREQHEFGVPILCSDLWHEEVRMT